MGTLVVARRALPVHERVFLSVFCNPLTQPTVNAIFARLLPRRRGALRVPLKPVNGDGVS